MPNRARNQLVLLAGALAAFAVPRGSVVAQTTSATQQYVVTYGEVAPNLEAERTATQLLGHLVVLARQNAGLVYFTVNVEIERPDFFTIIQVWRDAASYAAFTGAPSTQGVLGRLQPLLVAPLDERDGNLVVPQ